MTEQRGAGFPRLQNTAVDIGATESLAPTAAGVIIAGRITQSSGKGIFRAAVTLTDHFGSVLNTTTDLTGKFKFQGVDVQQMYILRVHHKQYDFADRILSPTTDLLNVTVVGTPVGGMLSSF